MSRIAAPQAIGHIMNAVCWDITFTCRKHSSELPLMYAMHHSRIQFCSMQFKHVVLDFAVQYKTLISYPIKIQNAKLSSSGLTHPFSTYPDHPVSKLPILSLTIAFGLIVHLTSCPQQLLDKKSLLVPLQTPIGHRSLFSSATIHEILLFVNNSLTASSRDGTCVWPLTAVHFGYSSDAQFDELRNNIEYNIEL